MRLRQIGKELEAIDNKAGPAAAAVSSQPAQEWVNAEVKAVLRTLIL